MLFLYKRACGSVRDSWVSRNHFLPRAPVPFAGGGSLGSKLRRFAHASSSVPSTVKCSSLSKPWARACSTTAISKRCDTSPCSRRSRFLLYTVASHTPSSIASPTNQPYSKLKSTCSISCRSLRSPYNTCNNRARSSCSGGIRAVPRARTACQNAPTDRARLGRPSGGPRATGAPEVPAAPGRVNTN